MQCTLIIFIRVDLNIVNTEMYVSNCFVRVIRDMCTFLLAMSRIGTYTRHTIGHYYERLANTNNSFLAPLLVRSSFWILPNWLYK